VKTLAKRQDMLPVEALTNVERPFRVLSLDGGGMRGIYTAQYLASLADGFSKKAGRHTLDVGSGFDLIVGTSTGAILACALAANIPLARVVQFYNHKGAAIFERRIAEQKSRNLSIAFRARSFV
jgi:patatin-like phospholipase/acyl hydrolase